jgi:hypothetical protein
MQTYVLNRNKNCLVHTIIYNNESEESETGIGSVCLTFGKIFLKHEIRRNNV